MRESETMTIGADDVGTLNLAPKSSATVTVADLLKVVSEEAKTDPDFLPLQHQLERFSPGTPIRGVPQGTGVEAVSFTHEAKARIDNDEVVLE